MILTAESKKAAWSPKHLNNGRATSYGFEWYIETVENRRIIGHGGSTSGFNASVQRFPEERLYVVLLTNTDETVGTMLVREVASFYSGRK